MLAVEAKPPLDFPDDPKKWDGWSNYMSENLYERLCLDQRTNPDNEQIQQHYNALLHWWQKKLPLKNQPSNPIAQLLGRGIDDAGRYLAQAQYQLLDPVRRRQIDEELATAAQQAALGEFAKYVSFSIKAGLLTAEAEANLLEFGERSGLTPEQTRTCIESELQRNKVRRVSRTAAPKASSDAEVEFLRILGLSHLNLADATALVRHIFVTIAESLGIHLERAERLLEDYLDQEESRASKPSAPGPMPGSVPAVAMPIIAPAPAPVPAKPSPSASTVQTVTPRVSQSRSPSAFINPIGARMVLIPAGEFVMGSNAAEAGPDEQPLTPVTLSEFYMSRHPVTNLQYEQFDPGHRQKRMAGAHDDHPVVYVTSLEAMRYCEWLRQRDGRTYRLPTEAEWEYAARGADGRKFPWGDQARRGDLANFADATTSFPWRDSQVNDGYPETSPVGSFPRGGSFFGLEDMAGNVWEWCLDFYGPLPGAPKRNPRGVGSADKRVYRGGSWKSRFSNLRATARGANAVIYSCNDVGFRIACECGRGESL